jgi:hypothetical protein
VLVPSKSGWAVRGSLAVTVSPSGEDSFQIFAFAGRGGKIAVTGTA